MLVLTRYAPRKGDDRKRDQIVIELPNGQTIDIYLVNTSGRQGEIGIECHKDFKITRIDSEMDDIQKMENDERAVAKKVRSDKKKIVADEMKKKRKKRMANLVGMVM